MFLTVMGLKASDPEGTSDFPMGLLVAAFLAMGLLSFLSNYHLISGNWNLRKWSRRSMLLASLHCALFGVASGGSGPYWVALALIYFPAALSWLGFLNLRAMSLGFLSFFVAFWAGRALLFPERLTDAWPLHAAAMIGVTTCGVWMLLASSFYSTQGETVRRLLRESRRDRRRVREEQARSDRLLLNILPAAVAHELKNAGTNEPVYFESATVAFTDFQGFTGIAQSLSPRELVGELDRCFSFFDGLMDRYKLEKLKTIGDAYMFAGGIPTANRTHAVDAVLAAMEIQAFMNQMKAIKESQGFAYWELRVGIHSGPLVAGVIGEKKFAYDVWGETVNTASRMESAGVTGQVNLSATTAGMVSDFFLCESRGPVHAKNMGEMEMFLLRSLRPELEDPRRPGVPGPAFHRLYEDLERKTG
ncbi:MAG: adenylate/guanylate cyclase domain-containing protein [Spirochaetales bacterium]|nr:adenylate/guanylate cyclase domain-containing protein [Leptospiraceae bacterium]MCP5482667.1 adenylate/guanylate cyclase domain-containing protein [Spirochaetales bacterium]MCP5485049.1 adenylate/guanylate cyclase domain-containing protein [Spirochaetales bacterium]